MKELFEQMTIPLYFMRLEDKYWGLFLISLFVLFYINKEKYKKILAYSIGACILCLFPFFYGALAKVFPSIAGYYMVWHIMPITFIIGLGFTEIFLFVKESNKAIKNGEWILTVGMILLLFFAGNFIFISGQKITDHTTKLGKEIVDVYELMEQDMGKQGLTTAKIWGPSEIMFKARIYNANFRPIYGKDISDLNSNYSDIQRMLYSAYSSYESPDSSVENKEEQIMAIANVFNAFTEITCNYVIVIDPIIQDSDVDPIWIFEALGYEFIGKNETYQLFRRL